MIDYSVFNGKTVFITGATGLIGKALVKRFVACGNDVRIIASVRNADKAKRVFSECLDRIELYVSDVKDIPQKDIGANYVIHCASVTDSKSFVQRPVEVIDEAILGTKAVLDFARINQVDSFVFLSTMEVYGTPATDEKISETYVGNLDSTSVRACYPMSKRMCENMCVSYCGEYGVPAKIVRLTQTFGDGVEYNDARMFAEFARCAIEDRDIILKTKGETERSYLYTEDAVNAILTVLIKGANGEAYNAANESTYCSVFEMAKMVVDKFGQGKIKVQVQESDVSAFGYAPTLKMNLDCSKLKKLGWSASMNLEEMLDKLIDYMKGQKCRK